MWIRSQKKNILKDCISLDVIENKVYSDNMELGEYATEERAIKVLNDIQYELFKGIKFDDIYKGMRVIKDFVYEMPER